MQQFLQICDDFIYISIEAYFIMFWLDFGDKI